VTFGAVSQHLGILRDAGFVQLRREGNRRLYRADRERLGPLALALEAMWTQTLDRLADAVESDVGAR
jgi:DNA-binding transcriptional ArsR family regulator